MLRFSLLVGLGIVTVFTALPAGALTAVIEVNEDPYYTSNRSNFYGNHTLTDFYAPLPVFFEGWKSSPRDQITSYTWDFGDGSPTMNGFNGAHVYEEPGTYTATLTVTGQGGQTASTSIEINVRERDGVTYYVDAVTGNDSNPGTSPQQAWRTATHAFQGLANSVQRYREGDQILFRRGQTFEFTGHVDIGHTKRYGHLFTAFGEGHRPIIQYMGGSGNESMLHQKGWGLAHLSLVDLDIRCTTPDGSQRTGFWYSTGMLFHLMFLRVNVQEFAGGFLFSHAATDRRLSGVFIVQCTMHESNTTHIFGTAARVALLNNHCDLSRNHIAYITYLNTGVIRGNQFSRPAFGRHCLRVAGPVGFDTPTNNVWIEDNYFGGWIDPIQGGGAHNPGTRYNNMTVHFGPNTTSPQGMEDLVFQNNTIVDGEKLLGLAVYDRITVRNNLMWTNTPHSEGHIFLSTHPGFDQRPLRNVRIHDNTVVKDAAPFDGSARLFQIRQYAGPSYQGRTYHEDIRFTNNAVHMSGARVLWYESNDMNLVNEFTSNHNRYYTPSPNSLVARAGTSYNLTNWRSFSGDDMQSSVHHPSVVPVTGTASSPAEVDDGPITVTYSGAASSNGSGVNRVHLWVRKDHGAWVKTPYTSPGASGSIEFTPTQGNGIYRFWVQTEDNDGHFSLPKTVTPPWSHMSSRRTLSAHGDTSTAYGGGVHIVDPPPKDDETDPPPDPDPEPDPDTTPPDPGEISAPADTQTSPISVTYTGAADEPGGSGLHRVLLYARKSDGNWSYTGLDSTGSNGSFLYPAPTSGTYHFALVAIDHAGNQSPGPSGTGMATTVFSLPPPPSDGLVSHFRFDDDPSNGAMDSARPGVFAPAQGSVSLTPNGQIEGAYNFGGGHIDLGNMDVEGTGLTIAAWVNPATHLGWLRDSRIVSKGTGTAANDHWWMLSTIRESAEETRIRFRLKTQGGNTSTLIGSSGNVALNEWTHIAATFDGSHMRVYLNGEPNGQAAKSGTLAQDPSVPVWIGNQPNPDTLPWDGRIDDLRIYNYALSPAEIQSVMFPSDPEPGEDTTPPNPGSLTAPETASGTPIAVAFSGAADDPDGSGLAEVRLFYRLGGGSWVDSGMTSSSGSGTFQFSSVSTDGPYYFHIVATDNAGNSSAAPSGDGMAMTFYDANGPTVGGMTASTSQTNSGPVTLSYAGVSDPSGVEAVTLWVRPPGGSWTNTGQSSSSAPSGSFNFNNFGADGTYRFAVSAIDTLGNDTSTASGNGLVSVVYDTTPPSVGALSGPSSTDGGPVTLNYTGVSDANGVATVHLWVRAPGGAWADSGMQTVSAPSGSFSYSGFTSGGEYAFAIRAVDNAGNQSAAPSGSGMHTVTYDNTPPSAGSLTGPDSANSGPITLNYSGVTDETSGVKSVTLWARGPGSGWASTGQESTSAPSGSFSYNPAAGDGSYHFALVAEDNSGNKSATPTGGGQHSLTYDTTPPSTGSLTGPAITNEGPVTLNYAGVTDTTSSVESIRLWVRPPNGNWMETAQESSASPSGSFTFDDFSAEGSYAFALRATDTAENTSTAPTGSGQAQVIFDNTPPASGSIAGPEYAHATPVALTYSGVTDANEVASVNLWVRPPGGAWSDSGQSSSSAPSGSFSFAEFSGDGEYAFALRAEDEAGNTSPTPDGEGAFSLTYDTTAPSTGTLSAPESANEGPVSIEYSGVSDDASGVDTVALWVRPPGQGWAATGMESGDAPEGAFSFDGFSGEGNYRFAVRARDNAGNQSPAPSGSGQATILFDNTPPSQPVAEAPEHSNEAPIAISYSGAQDASGGSGLASVQLFVRPSGGSWGDTGQSLPDPSGSFEYTPTADGMYYFHLVAEDQLGNRSPEPSGNGLTSTVYDTTPPAIGTLSGPDGAGSGPVSFSYAGVTDDGSGVDRVTLWVRRPGGSWQETGTFSGQAPSGTLEFNAFTGSGTYYFGLVARDQAGNESPAPTGDGLTSLAFDNTPPPAPQLEGPEFATELPITLSYSGAVDDDEGSGIQEVRLYTRISGQGSWTDTGVTGPGGAGTLAFQNAAQEGTYYFHLVSIDEQGNRSPEASGSGMAQTIYDATPPATGALSGPSAVNAGPITINYSGVVDEVSGVDEVRLWARVPGAGWADTGMTSSAAPSGSFSFNAFDEEGEYAFAIQAEDRAGNASTAPTGDGQLQVSYDVTAPEPTSLESPTYANSTPIPVSYTASSEAGIDEVRLYYRRSQDSLWSDSGLVQGTASGEFQFTQVTTNATYHFALVVTDVNGNSSPVPAAGAPGLDTTVYDTSAPNAGSLSSPLAKGDGPLILDYSGVTDLGGSTIDLITLWVRPPGGSWSETGITSTSVPSGTLAFDNFGPDGSYHFGLKVRDKAGNESDTPTGEGSWTYEHDTTPPTLPALTVAPYVSSTPIVVSYSGASDDGSGLETVELWVRPEGQSWSNTGLSQSSGSGEFAFSATGEDGAYEFGVRARDVAGNATPAPTGEGLAQTVLDRQAPPAASIQVAEYSKDSSIEVSYSGAVDSVSGLEQVHLWARKGFEPWQETGLTAEGASGSFSYTGMDEDGIYRFYAQAEDRAGNRSPNPTGVGGGSTTYDSTPPTAGTLEAVATETNASPIELSYTGVVETGSGLESVELYVRRGTGGWQSAELTATTPSGFFSFFTEEDGTFHFDLRARDKAGNESPMPEGEGQVTVQLDGQAPTVGPLETPEYANESPVTVSYSGVSDVEGGSGLKEVELYVRRNSGAWVATGLTDTGESGAFEYNVTTGDGTYRFAVRAEDNAGNRSATPAGDGAAQTMYDTTAPTPGTASSPAYTNSASITVSYSGASDATSGIESVTLWARHEGGAWAEVEGAAGSEGSGTLSFSAPEPGSYDFALRARDNAGNDSPQPTAGTSTTVYDTEPPTLGSLDAPAQDDGPPISIVYSGVTDTGGSGLKSVSLWVRKGGGGWEDSGLVSDKGNGSFSYHGMSGNDTYYFSLVAEDRAGNRTADPTGDGMDQTEYNTDFTAGTAESPEFATELPIVVSYSGAMDAVHGGDLLVTLWVKMGDEGEWINTGQQLLGESGEFEFMDAPEDGVFHFSVQAQNENDDLTAAPHGNGDTTTIYDTTPPTALEWSSPATARTLPIEVDYTGVYDAGSGVKQVHLWVRQGEDGEWVNTGETAPGAEGYFLFEDAPADGVYYFYIQAEDNAGLFSPAPDELKEELLEPGGDGVHLLDAAGLVEDGQPVDSLVTIPEPGGLYQLTVVAGGIPLDGEWPMIQQSINGELRGNPRAVDTEEGQALAFSVPLEPGLHAVGIVLVNPGTSENDARGVFLEQILLQPLLDSPHPIEGAVEE